MSTTEENVALVRKFYEEAINQKDPTACERLLTDDFVHNNTFRGRAGQQEAVNAFTSAFPDLKNQILMTVAEEDRVAAHQKWTGTHEGEFLGIAAHQPQGHLHLDRHPPDPPGPDRPGLGRGRPAGDPDPAD